MLTASVDADGIASGDTTDVPWWSFSKTVIAVAALSLVRDGRASLDDRVIGAATLGAVLQHRAGMPDYGAVAAYHAAVAAGEPAWPVDVLLAAVAPANEPGEDPGDDPGDWRYSNVGYLHLRRFLQRRCDQPLDAVLGERVFTPLGVSGARVATTRAAIAGLAGIDPGYDPNWVYHGLVVGPLREAARLLHQVATGDLLPLALLAAMRTPYPLGGPIPGRPWRAPGYGLGVMVERDPPGAFGHTGGGPGSVCAIYHHPRNRITRAAFLPVGLPSGERDSDGTGAVERATLPPLETFL